MTIIVNKHGFPGLKCLKCTLLMIILVLVLGANSSLTAAVVVLTGLVGANFVQTALDKFGFQDPIARGIATASRYGLYGWKMLINFQLSFKAMIIIQRHEIYHFGSVRASHYNFSFHSFNLWGDLEKKRGSSSTMLRVLNIFFVHVVHTDWEQQHYPQKNPRLFHFVRLHMPLLAFSVLWFALFQLLDKAC